MRASLVSNLSCFHKLRCRCGVVLKAFAVRFSLASPAVVSLEKIHSGLKKINGRLWRELRGGALAGCYVGLYRVRFDSGAQALHWREVNRKTVSCLHGFATSATEKQRHSCLQGALEGIAQKLGLVQLALKRKADTPTKEEKCTIQSYEAELHRLCSLLRIWVEGQEPAVPC
jgi:hypothetical protein